MTAEIIVMNKIAIALAADSAVTIGQKIYNSANKLFALSKYHPVGIMIYGNALFMDIPWETIIKVYRKQLGKKKFEKLEEYANNFINFLGNNNPLFPETIQKKYFINTTQGYFVGIIDDIRKKVESVIKQKKKIKKSEIKKIISSVIKEEFDRWEQAELLQTIPKTHNKNLIKKYQSDISEIIKSLFEKLPLSKISISQLNKMSGNLFARNLFPKRIPGIVIAGFGDNEIFPSYKSFNLECVVGNILKYEKDKSGSIGFDNDALISPFAQSETVATFIEGIDPVLRNVSDSSLETIFEKYPEIIIKNLKIDDENKIKSIHENLKIASQNILDNYKKEIISFSRKYNISPILNAVAVLPKDELASMAEALVNLTSLKRKISMDAETVGGPIDVAVISKGDGFVWIKRKHYFKAELNPHFLANYFEGDNNG